MICQMLPALTQTKITGMYLRFVKSSPNWVQFYKSISVDNIVISEAPTDRDLVAAMSGHAGMDYSDN